MGKSGSTYILRYDSVSKAVAYELNFEFIMNDGTTQTLNVPRNSGTTYSFQLPEGAIGFTVTLRALGNGTTIISALDTVSYTWSL